MIPLRRFSLSYKKLPYNVVWIEYPEVEPTLKALGIAPTTKKPDGSPMYTLPAIVDPSTGTGVAESFAIAEYLDKTYPDRPLLIPSGTRALQAAFIEAFIGALVSMFRFSFLHTAENILNPSSSAHFREARKNDVLGGLTVEEAYPTGEQANAEWKKVEQGFAKIDQWIGEGNKFVMGDTVSFADFALAGFIKYTRFSQGEDSPKWKDVASWNGGRWTRLVRDVEALTTL
ncbi:hypothetical protein D9758_014084 [Tetrapyrgos nigripes]|uniref:GST N-terminal domain-containing protein n=1 Tax=Tetrapyrgos nigripes TaxID=182062 RepID=A0A8H5FLW6_9AGAR|nr:hypothetical protein D9758_014084 [Tetrapyrgos nigripes]